ncbi:hypothetical protein PALB_15820 [Pseudoalteromonas luteoviolacea B = ATCC 29581]|nr:hypothetical protein PALB_15820 [Pseudoalteromonas luteoviolacea B = ATCC 29581]
MKYFWLLILLFSATASAKTPEQVRSAFLFQMSKFIEFPKTQANDNLRFCFFDINEGPGKILSNNVGLSINNRPIQVLQINSALSLIELSERCDITYIDEKHENDILSAWAEPIALNTVTVGESLAFLEQGGVAALVQEGSKIRLYINKQVMNRHNFKVLSRLLAVAKFYPD